MIIILFDNPNWSVTSWRSNEM